MSILLLFGGLIACSGGDPAATVDVRERPGGEEGRVVINPENFSLRYAFDCEPLNCVTECSIQEGDWFECDSPFILNQNSEEHTVREGVLRLEVRSTHDEEVSPAAQIDTLVLFEFDFDFDVVHGLETDGSFFFEDVYAATCSRSDCELRCRWEGDDCADCPVVQSCTLDEPFSVEMPEGLSQAELIVEACARDFGGRPDDEHCTAPLVLDFFPAPPSWNSLSAGARHTCGILEDNRLWCWGANNAGQVGIGSSTSVINGPTRVEVGSWSQVSAGAEHTCAISTSGELHCWGESSNGRLGLSNIINPQAPSRVGTDSNWIDLAAGGAHTCGVQDDGQLFCWGLNNSGQLGIGSSTTANTPQPVALRPGITQWISVTAGSAHTCALGRRGDGTHAAFCWGSGGSGRLGNATTSGTFNTPEPVGGSALDANIHNISAGDEHTCATLTLSGQRRSYCWGNGSSGQLGNGLETIFSSPDRVDGTDNYEKVTSGEEHSCGLLSSGQAYCWGENIRNQLGTDGDQTAQPEPVIMPDGVTLVDIEAGHEHTCGIGSNGRIYCWGRTDQSRLGLSSDQPSDIPGMIAWPRGEHIP